MIIEAYVAVLADDVVMASADAAGEKAREKLDPPVRSCQSVG